MRRVDDESCNLATALYELRLHHYVRGLEYAGSPYAFHTLGSCLAVSFEGYAQVRGFPKRSGGEDFHLLNKLAKTGPVIRLAGDCIELASRHSQRAPFGTGAAVARISNAGMPLTLPLFYHPACFAALRARAGGGRATGAAGTGGLARPAGGAGNRSIIAAGLLQYPGRPRTCGGAGALPPPGQDAGTVPAPVPPVV